MTLANGVERNRNYDAQDGRYVALHAAVAFHYTPPPLQASPKISNPRIAQTLPISTPHPFVLLLRITSPWQTIANGTFNRFRANRHGYQSARRNIRAFYTGQQRPDIAKVVTFGPIDDDREAISQPMHKLCMNGGYE